jgi:hypothetical protein
VQNISPFKIAVSVLAGTTLLKLSAFAVALSLV